MNKLLETTQKYPQTQIWNDSCSCEELAYAIETGATGATTNPVIVLNVLKKELKEWEPTIKEIIASNPAYTEDEVAWDVIKALGTKASKLLLQQFLDSNGQKGRISFQTNAKYYQSSEKMLAQAIELARVVPNSQIKAPTTAAGIKAFEEMTYHGISINATVSFTCAQAIQVAEAVERGLKRREAEGLSTKEMNPVCTIMCGRLDDYIKQVVKASDTLVSSQALEMAGVAVFKHAYNLYKKRNYRTKLLVAAFRNDYHWKEFIGGDVVLTITSDWQRKYNTSTVVVEEHMSCEVEPTIVNELLQVEEFKKAYDEDGLRIEEFDHYGALLVTMNQFLAGYDELIRLLRGYMIK